MAALLAVVSLFVPTFATAAVAQVEVGDTVWVGKSIGHGGTPLFPVYSETPADPANPGEPDYWAYCIEHDVHARTSTGGNVVDVSDFVGDNHFTDPAIRAKVFWILAHSYPAMSLEEFGQASGVPGISQNDAIEVTQYAIWRFTDMSFDPGSNWPWESDSSYPAYQYLVDGADASGGVVPATVSVTAPTTAQTAESLVGPFVVSTNQATASVTTDSEAAIVDADGNPIDTDAIVDGQEIYLDLRGSQAAGSATITAAVSGANGSGKIITVPNPNEPRGSAQSLALVVPGNADNTAEASVEWTSTEAPAPVIGTTLVDAADQDHNLVWNGGTVVDTVAYQNLVPGAEYTVTGELMLKSDGSATGITGSRTFTPAEANGSVDVTFTVPAGFDGETLVAFERLFEGAAAEGEPVAVHEDIDDAAQTVVVDEAPVVEEPAIGTTLVDAADQDHNLVWNGGTVTDTVAYQNLVPGAEYTVTGELMLKSDGSATGITGSRTFTPAEANGSVDVTFTVPAGFDGETLVAFERLFEGAAAEGEPVAVHEDIDDAAQTVVVDEAPVVEEPAIGTSLVDESDADHTLAWDGGTLVDTVAYRNLKPGTEYTVTGELMLKSDGSKTGITGSTTFTPSEANGTVDVVFEVPKGYAGKVLVAFERLFEGAGTSGEPVAVHEDIDDAAQTVNVETAPKTTTPKPTGPKPAAPKPPLAVTGGALPGIAIGASGLLLVAGATLLLTRRVRKQG